MTTRLAMAFVASLFFFSPATATLSLHKHQAPDLGKKWTEERKPEAAKPEPKNEGLRLTEHTEIKLDGQACRYESVPRDAQIILLEVGADKRTILKIHFQTKK